jgi:peptide/nickel transport system permease protein
LLSAVISVPISIAIGSYAALRREKIFDTLSSNLMLLVAALPEFVVAVLLVILLSTNVFHLLPATSPVPPGTHAWDYPDELVMPVATLVLAVAPYVSRIMRASMIEVLESDYVEMARLKGLPERTVLIRHALPNAIGPVFQVIAINLAYLAGGVVVIESVFNYPGIGLALVDAVNNHDIPVVQDPDFHGGCRLDGREPVPPRALALRRASDFVHRIAVIICYPDASAIEEDALGTSFDEISMLDGAVARLQPHDGVVVLV